jgi:YHS domain-containing protein
MKLSQTLSIVVAMLLVASLAAVAEDAKQEATKDAPLELKNQTHCPVMGGVIDSTVFSDIQGQRVYQCCPMCSAKLEKDPDTFFKKAAAEGILFENIQTTCPVSGEELEDKSVYTDFEGRRIVLCSEECRVVFGKDPATYLSKMTDYDMRGHEGREGHKGHKGHQGHGSEQDQDTDK